MGGLNRITILIFTLISVGFVFSQKDAKTQVEIFCSKYKSSEECLRSQTWILTGERVVFSKEFKSDNGNGLVSKISNTFVRVESVYIFALEAVDIDFDLLAPYGKLNVTIFAPTWTINGQREIKLNTRGPDVTTNSPIEGGTFFGIGREFLFKGTLKITANQENPATNEQGKASKIGVQVFHMEKGIQDVKELMDNEPVFAPNNFEILEVLEEYKKFLRKNLNTSPNKKSLDTFLTQLETGDNLLLTLYDKFVFVGELLDLENKMYKSSNLSEYLSQYRLLLKKVFRYSRKMKKDQQYLENKKVLSYLYTSVLGRIYTLEEQSEEGLITKLLDYIKITTINIEDLNDKQQRLNTIKKMNSMRTKYITRVNEKTKEAKYFIETEVATAIEKDNQEIRKHINSLLEETIQKRNDVINDKNSLEEIKSQLKIQIVVGVVLNIISFVGEVVLMCFGVLGKILGVGMAILSKGTKMLWFSEDPNLPSEAFLPAGDNFFPEFGTLLDNEKGNLKTSLVRIRQEVGAYPEASHGLTKQISELEARLANAKDLNEVESVRNEIKKALRAQNGLNGRRKKETGGKTSYSNKLKGLKSSLVPGVSKIANEYQSDKKKLEEVNKAIESAEDKIKILESFEENIRKTLIPNMQKVEDDLKVVASQLANKSEVVLEVTKWKIKSFLKDVKNQIKQMTLDFSVHYNIARSVEKLEEAMNMLIGLYNIIQTYQKDKDLANLIVDISSIDATKVEMKDPKVRNAVSYLETIIASNSILLDYRKIMSSLQQYVFPFAHKYFQGLILPKLFRPEENIKNSASTAVRNLKEIQSKLLEYLSSITKIDEFTGRTHFSSDNGSLPFFIWENRKNNNMISRLLAGEVVEIQAEILNSGPTEDAIKFTEIEFVFRTKNKTKQPDLRSKLSWFKIEVTHMGYSYYRFNKTVYVITSDNVFLSYKFNKNRFGDPIGAEGAFEKLKHGNALLSPYTIWKLQLVSVYGKGSHKDLLAFKDEIDIELSGDGSYVREALSRGDNKMKLNVQDYYTPVL